MIILILLCLMAIWESWKPVIRPRPYISGQGQNVTGEAIIRIKERFAKTGDPVAVQVHRFLRAGAVILAGSFAALLCGAPTLLGDTQYYEHSFFDNSAMPDVYFYSSGKPSAP